MIFLIRRGRQAIHAVRVRQRFILAGKRRGGDRAIIKPELTPPFFTVNGGNCDICLSIISVMRRSDSAPISAIASARLSAAMATGSAWKLPPEITSRLGKDQRIIGHRIGLSQQYLFRLT